MGLFDSLRGLFDDGVEQSGQSQHDVETDDDNRAVDVSVAGDDEGVDPDEFDDEEIEREAAQRNPEEIAAGMEDDAADLVERWPGYDLDYAVESLDRLDDLTATEFADVDFAAAEIGSTDDEVSIALTVFVTDAGAYFGEVLRRTIGGEWRVTDEDGLVIELLAGEAATRVNALGVAESCLTGDKSFADKYRQIQQARAEVMRRLDEQG
jgi:hypothetical protein